MDVSISQVRVVARVILGSCLAGVLLAAVLYSPDSGPTLGGLSFAIGVLVSVGRTVARLPLGHLALAVACACWALVGGVVLWRFRGGTPARRPLLPLSVLGCAFFAFAALSYEWPAATVVASCVLGMILAVRWDEPAPGRKPSLTLEILLAILLAGAVVRFFSLAEQSPGFGTHGSLHLQMAIDFYERLGVAAGSVDTSGGSHPVELWPRVVVEQHGPMAMVNALGFALFGIGFVQARMTQALLGVVTVWLAFLFGRRLVDERVGLVLAFLLAVSPWYVAISRFNDAEHVLAPIQALAALYFVLRALDSGTWLDCALAGICCGLGWYVYAPNQALLVALLMFLTAVSVSKWRSFPSLWPTVLVFVGTFVAVSLPHFVTSHRTGVFRFVRSGFNPGGTGAYSPADIGGMATNIVAAFDAIFVRVDDQWFSAPTGGGLGFVETSMFAGGLVLCLRGLADRQTRGRSTLLLLSLIAGFLPAIVLAQLEFRRLMVAVLLVSVITAIIVTKIFVTLARAAPRCVAWPVLAASIVAYSGYNLHRYFDEVTVPESAGATYYVSMVEELRAHWDRGLTLVVLPRHGGLPEHRNSVRLGAYDLLRAAVRSGTPIDGILRFVTIDDLDGRPEGIDVAGGSIRLIASYHLSQDTLLRISRFVKGHDEISGPRVMDGPLGAPEIVVWEFRPP